MESNHEGLNIHFVVAQTQDLLMLHDSYDAIDIPFHYCCHWKMLLCRHPAGQCSPLMYWALHHLTPAPQPNLNQCLRHQRYHPEYILVIISLYTKHAFTGCSFCSTFVALPTHWTWNGEKFCIYEFTHNHTSQVTRCDTRVSALEEVLQGIITQCVKWMLFHCGCSRGVWVRNRMFTTFFRAKEYIYQHLFTW